MSDMPAKYQRKFKIHKGDEVQVLTGRSRGARGTVEKVDRKHDKVVIASVNVYKKHRKPDANNPEGGIVDKPMPIHISNVALVDPKKKKPTRVGYRIVDGKKLRVAKASDTTLAD